MIPQDKRLAAAALAAAGLAAILIAAPFVGAAMHEDGTMSADKAWKEKKGDGRPMTPPSKVHGAGPWMCMGPMMPDKDGGWHGGDGGHGNKSHGDKGGHGPIWVCVSMMMVQGQPIQMPHHGGAPHHATPMATPTHAGVPTDAGNYNGWPPGDGN